MSKKPSDKLRGRSGKKDFPGYKHYPQKEDIYQMGQVDHEIDPEHTKQVKTTEVVDSQKNEKDFEEDVSGGDLDIPGAELDDILENVGAEDEENNHYSLGGDNNLDENQGENRLS